MVFVVMQKIPLTSFHHFSAAGTIVKSRYMQAAEKSSLSKVSCAFNDFTGMFS